MGLLGTSSGHRWWRREFLGFCIVGALACATQGPKAPPSLSGPTLRREANGAPARPLAAEADWFWSKVRQRFPFHVQGTLVYEIDPNNWIVIVAEPPPHVELSAVAKTLGAGDVQARALRVGHDGWVKDAVAVVAGVPRDALNERVVRLEAAMFGTSHRVRPLRLAPPRQLDLPPAQLFVSPWELHDWITAADASFVSLDGQLRVPGRELLAGTARGVFRSESPGLVVWALPAGADLCDNLVEARTFLVESDLPLGALKTTRHGLIVARERVAAPEALPPLRVESLLALASAPNSLGQSFQRLSLFAGKLPSGDDWAPIFLSDELIDTELGSLLNIADQLLKSWSLNGTVSYQNFSYPQPARWASGKGVMDELDTNTLTFNWNTKGIAAKASIDSADVMTVEAGGALPITYLPEGLSGGDAAVLERRNRRFFSELRDPNLTRVTSYAGMYHLLKLMDVRQSCRAASATERANERSLERRTEAFIDSVGRRDDLLSKQVGRPLGSPGPAILQQVRDRLASVDAFPADMRRDFIHNLGGVTGLPANADKQKRDTFKEARALALDYDFNRLCDAVLDRQAAQAEFASLGAVAPRAWVHTPTLVLSRAAVANNVYAVGGHNLYNFPTRVAVSPDVPPHQVRIGTLDGEPAIMLNAADRGAVGDLMATMKDVLDNRVSAGEGEARLRDVLARRPARAARPPALALSGDREPLRPYWDAEGTLGLAPSRETGAPEAWDDLERTRPKDGYAMRVVREADQYAILAPGATRWIKRVGTDAELYAFLRGRLEQPDLRGKQVTLQLEGFERENVRGVIHTLALKTERSDVRLQTVYVGRGVRGKLARAYRRMLGGPREVFAEAVREVEGAGGERLYEYGFTIKQRSLVMRIALYAKSRLSQVILERIRSFLAGFSGAAGDLSRALDGLARESAVSRHEVHVWIDDNGGDLDLSWKTTGGGRRSIL